jgi:hypothetical protein
MNFLSGDDSFQRSMDRRSYGLMMVVNMDNLRNEIQNLGGRALSYSDIARFQTTLGRGIDDINYLNNQYFQAPDGVLISSCINSALQCTSYLLQLQHVLSPNDLAAFYQYHATFLAAKPHFDVYSVNQYVPQQATGWTKTTTANGWA